MDNTIINNAKVYGFSDKHIQAINSSTSTLKSQEFTFRMVDTCAGEFEAVTPYFYSVTLPQSLQSTTPKTSNKKKIVILGAGPIRIGQGIEFDYSTVHAVQAVQKEGYEAIIINNNPETVSTDFDISDRLYFEPLFIEEVFAIIEKEKENLLGVIPQFGGQTAINLTTELAKRGIPILGSSPSVIDKCENREETSKILQTLNIAVTPWAVASNITQAKENCKIIGYPVLVRPSFAPWRTRNEYYP